MKTRIDRSRIPVAKTVALSLLALTLIAPWALGQDPDRIAEIRRLAEQGDTEAQGRLGAIYAYSQGVGVPQDDAEAVRWFRLAADQGQADAQFLLGAMYANGEGVPKDEAEAARWYRLTHHCAIHQFDWESIRFTDSLGAASKRKNKPRSAGGSA